MAHEKLSMLLETYSDNPGALHKIEEYISTKLPKYIQSFIDREKRRETLEFHMEKYINIFLSDPNTQFYYIPVSNTFIHYNSEHYKLITEDNIWHIILSDISSKQILMDWKYKVKTKIIKHIKERNIIHSIPESNTIQFILKFLTPMFFRTKEEAKYFLTCLGDNIFKKTSSSITLKGPLIHIFQSYSKPFISYIQDISYFLFQQAINPTLSFRYYLPPLTDYNHCRLIHFNSALAQLQLWKSFIKCNLLDIIAVSSHYSKRFSNSDSFIMFHSHNKDLRTYTLYMEGKNDENIINDFMKSCLIEDTKQSIGDKKMLFLWKDYLFTHSFPYFLDDQSLLTILHSKLTYNQNEKTFSNLFSPYLCYVHSFMQFWKDHIYINPESDFELGELCTMYNNTNVTMNIDETKMHSLIKHFYPHFMIQGEKYILNIGSDLWDKEKEIRQFLEYLKIYYEATVEDALSFYKVYILYCNYAKDVHFKYIPSKKYFEKIIQKIIPSEFLTEISILKEYWDS